QLLAFVREDQLLQYNPVDYKCHAFAHFFREEMLQLRFAFEVLKKDIRIQKCADLLRGHDLLMVPNAEVTSSVAGSQLSAQSARAAFRLRGTGAGTCRNVRGTAGGNSSPSRSRSGGRSGRRACCRS